MSNNNPYGLRWLTLNNVRAFNKLVAAQVRAEQKANNMMVENNRQNRRNMRNATKAAGNVNRFSKLLQKRYGITNMNVVNNYRKYNSTIPGLTNETVLAGHLYNILRGPWLTGNTNNSWPFLSGRNRINVRIANYMGTGMSQKNATRQVLQKVFGAGARTAAAVRTIQRKFRQKRTAKKLGNVHRELLAFKSVAPIPFPGMTPTNAQYYLRPSNVKRAPAYLANQGYRIVKRVRRT